jgi:hypothetical protein
MESAVQWLGVFLALSIGRGNGRKLSRERNHVSQPSGPTDLV